MLAAVGEGDDGAVDAGELGPDEVLGVVVELLLGEALAGDADLQNRHGGGGEVDDLRGQDAGRKLAELVLRCSGDLGVGGVQTGPGLEEDLDVDYAVVGGGFDVLDVVDQRGDGLFVGGGEAAFELFGVEAGVLKADGDDWDVDVGEDVSGRADDHDRGRDKDEQREDDEGIWPVKGNFDYPHGSLINSPIFWAIVRGLHHFKRARGTVPASDE